MVPLLVKLGQSEDLAVLGGLARPSGSEFGVFWKEWDTVIKGWEPADVAHLIKGLTLYEKFFNTGFGSVPPVAQLFHLYSWAVKPSESALLADWILAPDGHPKLPHLWPVKLPQARRHNYDVSGPMAMRAAASLSR